MRSFLSVLCFAGLSALLSAAESPNILLIVSEDNGPELGCYGQPYVQTPVLDKLAAGGIRFERAYVPQAGCSQSRAALMTGLYPHQNGQIGLATWKFGLYDGATPNLVRSLKGVGYRTGIIGKLHINPKEAFPFDFRAISTSNFARKDHDQYSVKAKEFIEASNEPFFLSVNYPDAHRPFIAQVDGVPSEPLTEQDVTPLAYFGLDTPELRRQTADYLNCMSRLDVQVGELLEVLKASGKASNTLIVYMGDHGADMLRGKRTSYEGGVRVPLIVSWAGQVEPGQVRHELVSTLDLMPTFLEAAGAKPVDGLPGLDLAPMFDGRKVKWRPYLFTEYHTHSAHNYYPQRTVRDDRYKLISNLMPGVVNPGYEFTRRKFFEEKREVVAVAPEPVRSAYELMEQPPAYELYDLEADPYEFTNLAENEDHAEVLARLQGELEDWRDETNDPMRDSENILRLKAEIDACLDGVDASKAKLNLTYPEYFFSASAAIPRGNRKNVLFIAIDDLRPALRCFGDPVAITPHIDTLARRGVIFNRAYCQLAVCAPSRHSLLTGLRPDTIKVWDLGTHFREALPEAVTLPQAFKEAGYSTRSIGKILHGSGAPSQDPPSWSVDPILDTNREPELRYARAENLKGSGLKRNSSEAASVEDDYYIDGLICRETITTLKEYAESGESFFLAVGFKKPHLPFCAPQRYWELYDREAISLPASMAHPRKAPEFAVRSWGELEGYRDIAKKGSLTMAQVKELRHGYYACVSYIDAQVGRLMETLEASGLLETTVICLWGDHGFHLGEQGLWTKANNYEWSTRVPLLIADPGREAGKTEALVELVDVYPTLVELCELPIGSQLEGQSLVPLLKDPDKPWAESAMSQYPRAKQGNRHSRHGDFMGYTIRTRDYRYVEWRNSDTGDAVAVEFYDHLKDPDETINVAQNSDYHSILKRHEALLYLSLEKSRSASRNLSLPQ